MFFEIQENVLFHGRRCINGLSGWSMIRLTKILFLFLYLHLYLYKHRGEHIGFQDSMGLGETISLLVSRVVGPGAGVVSPFFRL